MKADQKIAQLRQATTGVMGEMTALIEAMVLTVFLSRSEMGPRPWVEKAKEIVREFEK
jgi:hypothetical protein